eukprot:CAMPEP_0171074478 /NCGR_PEP_ID=MMETSP0766_2-20121228/12168_1 /TAXON_ID=439317 /ORGANISM="Gambierdiscus australes, Strain CAWD 149" /LENGTH=213 /DNA_ID=CAMNT_0011531269 /DNA_START=12 /DNA_END=653 /DNA_ORIENTATION=+
MVERDADGSNSATGPVHVFAAFHVANDTLPGFCEAACGLLAHARADAGCSRFDFQREIDWVRKVSNETHTLFMVRQEWAEPKDLESHVASAHAQRFDHRLVDDSMLVCAPSLTLCGPPLSNSDLGMIAAEARAAAAASSRPPSQPGTTPVAGTRPVQAKSSLVRADSMTRTSSDCPAKAQAKSSFTRTNSMTRTSSDAPAKARSLSRSRVPFK